MVKRTNGGQLALCSGWEIGIVKRRATQARRYWFYKYGPFVCGNCGAAFAPKARDRIKYCSRKCAFEYKSNPANSTKGEYLAPRSCVVHFKRCEVCDVLFVARNSARECCGLACNRKMREAKRLARFRKMTPDVVKRCVGCGKSFVLRYGDGKRIYCTKRCGRRSESRRRGHVERARKQGANCERVEPLIVLRRDRWRCQLCGISTPKRLRGTIKPNAPEVDHIVALAAGGEHSYRNVQCACRKCNLSKGVKALGQPRFL